MDSDKFFVNEHEGSFCCILGVVFETIENLDVATPGSGT